MVPGANRSQKSRQNRGYVDLCASDLLQSWRPGGSSFVQGAIACARLAGAQTIVFLALLVVFGWLVSTGVRTGWQPYSLGCILDPACWPAPGETNAALDIGRDYDQS